MKTNSLMLVIILYLKGIFVKLVKKFNTACPLNFISSFFYACLFLLGAARSTGKHLINRETKIFSIWYEIHVHIYSMNMMQKLLNEL